MKNKIIISLFGILGILISLIYSQKVKIKVLSNKNKTLETQIELITKQNEIYQINDSTEKYNISGSLNINLDNSYSFNISMTDANNSKTMSYYKTVTSNHIDVNYNAPKDSEEDLLNYVKDNMQAILDKVNNQ